MRPKALIFDFDGLIVDTEVPIYEAWQENYAAFGHELSLEYYVGCVGSDFGGFDPQQHLEDLTGEKIDWAEWDEKRERRAHEIVNGLGPLPGVVKLLDVALESGIPCAVASSSPRSWVDRHLNRIGLMDRFRLTRTIDDVSAPKPSPELFLAASEALRVNPGDAVVFEDSLNGLKAAITAGNPCVIVPNRITSALDFTGAVRKIDSLEQVTIQWLSEIFTT